MDLADGSLRAIRLDAYSKIMLATLPKNSLGEQLVAVGLLTEVQLDLARREQARTSWAADPDCGAARFYSGRGAGGVPGEGSGNQSDQP